MGTEAETNQIIIIGSPGLDRVAADWLRSSLFMCVPELDTVVIDEDSEVSDDFLEMLQRNVEPFEKKAVADKEIKKRNKDRSGYKNRSVYNNKRR